MHCVLHHLQGNSGGLWFWGCEGQAALVVVVFVRHLAVFLWWDVFRFI